MPCLSLSAEKANIIQRTILKTRSEKTVQYPVIDTKNALIDCCSDFALILHEVYYGQNLKVCKQTKKRKFLSFPILLRNGSVLFAKLKYSFHS